MNYQELHDFLSSKMRLSHIYQPVMIKTLLNHGGVQTDKEIGTELLKYDISQIEYYQNITNNMVGRVLRHREVVKKEHNRYQLLDVEDLCESIYLCLTRDTNIVNDTFNIGAKDFTTMKEDFQAVLDYAGHGKKVIGFLD